MIKLSFVRTRIRVFSEGRIRVKSTQIHKPNKKKIISLADGSLDDNMNGHHPRDGICWFHILFHALCAKANQ